MWHNTNIMEGSKYMVGVWIVGVLSFLAIWIYALASWGFLIGLMIGWIPALIGGVILGFLWPLVVLAVIGIIILISNSH